MSKGLYIAHAYDSRNVTARKSDCFEYLKQLTGTCSTILLDIIFLEKGQQ